MLTSIGGLCKVSFTQYIIEVNLDIIYEPKNTLDFLISMVLLRIPTAVQPMKRIEGFLDQQWSRKCNPCFIRPRLRCNEQLFI